MAAVPRGLASRQCVAKRPAGRTAASRATAASPAVCVRAASRDARVNAASIEARPTSTVAASPATDPNDMSNVLGIILGGGAGSRLYPLTKKRAKPAVPLGANYRLIDIPVSNCVNSNINKIYCLTQYNSASLNRHVSQAYNPVIGGVSSGGFVEVLAAQQSMDNPEWFQGTADAIRQFQWLFEESKTDDYVILSGDHLYRMDYADFVAKHREFGADITVAALPCDAQRATAFGLMLIDDSGKVTAFKEKPSEEELPPLAVDTTVLGLSKEQAEEMPFIASMGIYVFKAEVMKELLMDRFTDALDFGGEVIPQANEAGFHVQAYAFDGYWEDIGTIKAFYEANIMLTDRSNSKFSFSDDKGTVYTQSRFLPPSKVIRSNVTDCVIGDGVSVLDATLSNSVIGLRSQIGEGCVIEKSLIMGADFYEKYEACEALPDCTPVGIGAGTVIRGAIVDKNCRIGPNCQIVNKAGVVEAKQEDAGYFIKDGIVVVCKDTFLAPGTVI